MNIRFYRDPKTDEPHIHGHGVDEDEVADVLESPGEDRQGREGSRRHWQDTSRTLPAGDLCSGPGAGQCVCGHSI